MFENSIQRRVLAGLLLASVLAVCVSPNVDLDECALRAKRNASVFFWLLAAALFLFVMRACCAMRAAPVRLAAIYRHTTWLPPDIALLPTIQVLRI